MLVQNLLTTTCLTSFVSTGFYFFLSSFLSLFSFQVFFSSPLPLFPSSPLLSFFSPSSLLLLSSFSFLSLSLSLPNLKGWENTPSDIYTSCPMSTWDTRLGLLILNIILDIGIILGVSWLVSYQHWLVWRNTTTIEDLLLGSLKRATNEKGMVPFQNPYDLGLVENLKRFHCNDLVGFCYSVMVCCVFFFFFFFFSFLFLFCFFFFLFYSDMVFFCLFVGVVCDLRFL